MQVSFQKLDSKDWSLALCLCYSPVFPAYLEYKQRRVVSKRLSVNVSDSGITLTRQVL